MYGVGDGQNILRVPTARGIDAGMGSDDDCVYEAWGKFSAYACDLQVQGESE